MAQYRSTVDRGWLALVAAVQPDGKLGWVQRVGAGPDQVGKDDTQLYGVGAFLLAASEVSKLPAAAQLSTTAKQKHCLPLRSSALR